MDNHGNTSEEATSARGTRSAADLVSEVEVTGIVIPEMVRGINRPTLRTRTTEGAPIHAGNLDPHRRGREVLFYVDVETFHVRTPMHAGFIFRVSFSLPFIAFYRSVLNSISVAPELKKFPVFPFLSCVVSTALRFGFGFTVFDCDRIWLSVLLSTPFPVVLSVDL
ncbi:hypothetical protein BHE74_00016122 [Ensete ventricosum]|nr:hypothetical protein BHE74_00016122 [Ensete ventricosum]